MRPPNGETSNMEYGDLRSADARKKRDQQKQTPSSQTHQPDPAMQFNEFDQDEQEQEQQKPKQHAQPPKAYQQPRMTVVTEMVSQEDMVSQNRATMNFTDKHGMGSFINPDRPEEEMETRTKTNSEYQRPSQVSQCSTNAFQTTATSDNNMGSENAAKAGRQSEDLAFSNREMQLEIQ